MPLTFEDEDSAVFNLGNTIIKLNGPMDRPLGSANRQLHGSRGHIWKIAK